MAQAYVSNSSHYRIQVDSINVGGATSSSADYGVSDTVGEIATGDLTGTSYKVKAGYQAMLLSSISITAPADSTLSPSIDGVTGGTATGELDWKVTTDNSAGYTLALKASTNPALKSGSDSFADYTPAGAIPDFTWTVAASAAEFGFSPEGTDVASRYLDDGASTCGTGSTQTTDRCWDAFSTSNVTVASSNTGNSPSGATTAVKLQATSGSGVITNQGTYTATIVATALAQ